jgi:transmembrane sensor
VTNQRAAIEEEAAWWVMRQQEPDFSTGMQEELEAWLDLSFAHKAAFWRLEAGYAGLDSLSALPLPSMIEPPSKRTSFQWRIACAVSLMLAPVGLYLAIWGSGVRASQEIADYSTKKGQVDKIMLADGTRVDLDAVSHLQVAFGTHSRTAWLLQGDVYFEVKPDVHRPFIIHAGAGKITVVGTKFLVSRDPGSTKVSVVDGRVRLERAQGGAGEALLTRGEIGLTDGRRTVVSGGNFSEIMNRLGWRTGVANFNDTTLADAARLFNRYNIKELQIADPAVGQMRINGYFHLANVDGFARLLKSAYGLQIEERDRFIRISAR